MNNTMSEPEKYTPSARLILIRCLLWGFLLTCCFSLAAPFVPAILPANPSWILYEIFRWPSGAIPGMLLGTALVLLRRTTVVLVGNRILVSTPLRRKSFDLSELVDSSVTSRVHILSYGKFTTVKCCLIFRDPDKIQKCPLNGFGEKELETVLAAVRERQSMLLSAEEKRGITAPILQKEYSENPWESSSPDNETEAGFSLPAPRLLSYEKRWLRKISVLLACAAAVIGGLDALALASSHTLDITLLFLTLLASAIPVILSVMWISLHFRGRICAENVIIGENHLLVGGKYYSWSGLCRVRMTSPRKKSSSAFPVQRYMYLTTAGGTDRYWLGSEASFGGYHLLCSCLEKALIFSPDKLKYI